MLRNEGMYTIPGFNQIQFEGFCRFINQGLIEELSKFPKIEDREKETEFQLFSETYQLGQPLINERDAVYQLLTYSSTLYVSTRLIWKSSRNIQEQEILIGKIPLMTSLGTSIVKGIYRIVINQIVRSPGIYYQSKFDHKGILVYTATIISDSGGRLQLEIDRKGRMWARVSRKQKISILVLSSAMGLNLSEILENVCYPEIFLSFLNDLKNQKKSYKMESKENAILEFYKKFTNLGEDLVYSDFICEELHKKFFRQRCELGRIGRRNMNRKLNLDIPHNNTFLLPRDVLAAADHLIGMRFRMDTLDDMNHLKNKRIRSVADLLQEQFGSSLTGLEYVVERSLYKAIKGKSIPTHQDLVKGPNLLEAYESFLGLHALSQVWDQMNPLTQIVHRRKWSFLGPGGLIARTATSTMRDIHPSYYGRLCPIDTSEGLNVGLSGSLTIHAKIGDWGSLESPFFEICKGSKRGGRMLYLSPNRDEYYMIAAGDSLSLNRGPRDEQVVSARYRQDFLTIAWERVHLRSIFPFQNFSIAASLIPFLEHNDATRALMSSNMQRQAVPLIRSEKCIVGTGLEGQVARDSGVTAIAEREGKIISTDSDKILLSSNRSIFSTPLIRYQRSNRNTWMHQKTQVQPGECIKKGQVLADGAATVGGELALGKNVLVAYMPWHGYNFEDAVLISERLVYEDIYTSFSIRKYEIEIIKGCDRTTNLLRPGKVRSFRKLDKNGIVRLGSWVETDDILVGKLTRQIGNEESSPPENRFAKDILSKSNSPLSMETEKETSLKLPTGGSGRVIDVNSIRKPKERASSYTAEMIRVYILQKREIKVGDKVAGRHGNKGVVSKILPRQDMPYLQDGTPVDMVFNPLGVPSRMNVGQIFECSLGLAGSLLDRHYRIAPLDERYEQEASRKLVFSELYEASKQTANPWVFEPEYPGKSRIFDGRTGDPFDQPVLIGRPYILKLIHQVDDKIHARSSASPYSRITQQPLQGKAKQGGQRVGEMEVWALEGFGVSHILQEILTYKSDHMQARRELIKIIISGRRIPKPDDAPESFRLLVRELRSLAIELNHFLISEKNFQITRKEV